MTEIRPYEFDSTLSAAFLSFRRELYHDQPAALRVDPGPHPSWFEKTFGFYGGPGNAHRHFAALDGGRVVGHVSAFVNHDLHDEDGMPVGALGCFECVEDGTVARALVDAGVAWLGEHVRADRVWAPMDFDIWHRYRFRIRGNASRAIYGEPCNPAWYPRFFEEYGFVIRDRWESLEVGAAALRALLTLGEQRYQERLADGYRFDDVDAVADFPLLHPLVMDSFSAFLGFTPLDRREFEETFAPRWEAADLRPACIVRDRHGHAVGFALAYPEGPRAVLYMIGVTQDEVHRRHGLGRAAFHACVRRMLDGGYERAVFALMSTGSGARALMAPFIEEAQSEHALYQLDRT